MVEDLLHLKMRVNILIDSMFPKASLRGIGSLLIILESLNEQVMTLRSQLLFWKN